MSIERARISPETSNFKINVPRWFYKDLYFFITCDFFLQNKEKKKSMKTELRSSAKNFPLIKRE